MLLTSVNPTAASVNPGVTQHIPSIVNGYPASIGPAEEGGVLLQVSVLNTGRDAVTVGPGSAVIHAANGPFTVTANVTTDTFLPGKPQFFPTTASFLLSGRPPMLCTRPSRTTATRAQHTFLSSSIDL